MGLFVMAVPMLDTFTSFYFNRPFWVLESYMLLFNASKYKLKWFYSIKQLIIFEIQLFYHTITPFICLYFAYVQERKLTLAARFNNTFIGGLLLAVHLKCVCNYITMCIIATLPMPLFQLAVTICSHWGARQSLIALCYAWSALQKSLIYENWLLRLQWKLS